MSDTLATQPLRRNLALTQLGLGVGARIVVHTLQNVLRSPAQRDSADNEFYARQGQVLAQKLGRLKGGVMKAGQLLALYGDYFLPEAAVRALDSLQTFAEPVAWSVLEPVLRHELGSALDDLEVDPRPIGAASLGQVHRAWRRSDRRALCIKIQYPGVADAIESDIATLSWLFSVSRLAPRGLDLRPIFAEIREMLRWEVDYRRERRYAETYRRLLAHDQRFVVPEVFGEYSTRRVLTMSFEDGLDARSPAVHALPQERRDRLGLAAAELVLREIFDWRLVQTDPNFGNYRFRLDPKGDRIVLLDFGATRRFARSFVSGYADVVLGGIQRDTAMIVRGAAAIGILRTDFPHSVLIGFGRMCMVAAEPMSDPALGLIPPRLLNQHGAYRWAESDLPRRAGREVMVSSMTVHYRLPPREIVFLHRRLIGVFVMLATLEAEIDLRAPTLAVLCRFREAGGTPQAPDPAAAVEQQG